MANPTIVIQPPSGHTRWMKLKTNLLRSPMLVSSSRDLKNDKQSQNINKWKRVSSAVMTASRTNTTINDTGSKDTSACPLGSSKRPSMSNSAQSLCSVKSNQSNNSRFSVRRGNTKRTGAHLQNNLLPRRLVVKAWEEPGMMGHGETKDTIVSEITGKRRNIVGLELIHRLFQIWQPQLAKSWRSPAKPEISPMLRYRTRSPRCRPPTPKHE